LKIHPERVQTNIVIFDVGATGLSAPEFTARLKNYGVVMGEASTPREVRAVTHFDVTRQDCARAAEAVAQLLKQISAPQKASDTHA